MELENCGLGRRLLDSSYDFQLSNEQWTWTTEFVKFIQSYFSQYVDFKATGQTICLIRTSNKHYISLESAASFWVYNVLF